MVPNTNMIGVNEVINAASSKAQIFCSCPYPFSWGWIWKNLLLLYYILFLNISIGTVYNIQISSPSLCIIDVVKLNAFSTIENLW